LINSTLAVSILLTAVTLPNLIASVCLTQSAVYTRRQKVLQMVLVWVVPLVGAVFVLSVWAHDRMSAARDPARSDEGPWLPGIGPMSDNSHPTSSFGDLGTHDGQGGNGGGQSN
jgi:hypothetical protein